MLMPGRELLFFFLLSLHETEKDIFKVKHFLSFAHRGCFEVHYTHASPVLLFFIVLNLEHGT